MGVCYGAVSLQMRREGVLSPRNTTGLAAWQLVQQACTACLLAQLKFELSETSTITQQCCQGASAVCVVGDAQQDITRGRNMVDTLYQGATGNSGTHNAIMSSEVRDAPHAAAAPAGCQSLHAVPAHPQAPSPPTAAACVSEP